MKTNKIKHHGRSTTIVIVGVILAALTIFALYIGYEKLRALWLEQCIVRDMERQVTISSGKMVKADAIAKIFGIHPGANLALIDYRKKREETLATIANLRDLRVKRRLPDCVTIDIEERVPVARMGLRGQRKTTGRIVDAEGVVFRYFRNTELLPIILESSAPGTAIGRHVSKRAKAALEFIDVCHNPEFQTIGILEIDLSSPDYLLATINTGSNYAKLKLAWDDMDDPTPASRADLTRRLTHLKQAIGTRIGSNSEVWNATEPDCVYADTKGKL